MFLDFFSFFFISQRFVWSMEMKPSFRIPTFKSLSQFTCTLIFFINFTITVSYSRTSSRIPLIPYSDKCASVVPEATPTTYETLAFPNLRPSSTYYTGGDRILGRNSFYFEKYLTFRTSPNVYATNISGVYKIEAVLTFRTYNTYHPSSNSTYGRSYYSRTRVGRLTFKLHGFWSESSGKACMVGFASWFSRKGDSLYLDAILKLYYAKNSASYTSLVSGKLESLRYPNDESYFEPISILAFPEINKYEYKLISEEIVRGFPGGIDIPKNLTLGLHPGDFCSVFSTGFSTYKLEYASKCSSLRNCSQLDWGTGYMPHFISLYTIQCSEFGKNLRFLVEFTNSSYVGYRQMFDPNTTLVAEGSWDENRNQLCIVACRILNSTDSSLGNAHVGDCSFRLSLWYPAFLSIRNSTRSEGQIWTNKTATDVGYFDRITFRNSDYDRVGVPGLKYEYTELDKVRKLCSRKSVKKGETYPNGHSYEMRFDMTVRTSKGNFGWGYAVPIFIGNESFEQYPVAVSPSSSWGDYAEIALEPAAEVNNAPLNVSYRISLSPEYDVKMGGGSSVSNLSLSPNGQIEISAEGVYDAGTGQVCMVGCRNVGSANDSLDCEILVNFQFPGSNGNNGGFIKGSIESTRKNSDPLFFEHLNMSSSALSTPEAKQSIWRMDLEIIMVLISNTFACVFVGLQLYYVKKHPNVLPFISLVMLVILTLGHMIPLVLNFEALFLESHDRQNVLLGSSGWLEVNEVIVRVVTMVAFLLQFRLLQLAWTAHLSEGTEKGIWVAEKKGLFVTLPLYIVGGLIALFVNWRKNNYGNAVLTWSRGFTHQQQYSLWGNLRSYAGLILDGFLFPQILLNIFQMSREIALSPSFYLGTTSVRLVPHAYDLYRGHNYVPAHVNGTYIYANPNADFYSAAWDIIIPCAGMLFAGIIYLQQRYGGRCILPSKFRELELYAKVSVVSTE